MSIVKIEITFAYTEKFNRMDLGEGNGMRVNQQDTKPAEKKR